LRRCFLDVTRSAPPSDADRQHWTTELADRSAVVMTSIDDLPPGVAAAQLRLVADDLGWHAENLERPRGEQQRRLWRKVRRLTAEAQERQLQTRLEDRFGSKNVGRFERMILVLICFVLGLLVIEATVELPHAAVVWLHLADAAACAVFLWEFAVKLWLAPQRGRWFWRHVLIDLVPSIPFGLLLWGMETHLAADAVRSGRLVRFLRLPRLARYVRIVRPAIRLLRAFAFLARGLDRLARRYGPLLNRNVILYPTPAERRRATIDAESVAFEVRRLQGELQGRWKDLVLSAAPEHRPGLARSRVASLAECRRSSGLQNTSVAAEGTLGDGRTGGLVAALPIRPHPRPMGQRRLQPGASREITAELLLRRLGGMTPNEAAASLGDELTARVARVVRTFSRPPTRWLPVVRGIAPRLSPAMTDAQVVAAGSRRLAMALKRYHDAWFWLADLHGTVAPSEFVDRIGTMLVKSSFRPAYRLALFGGVYLLVLLVLSLVPLDFLTDVETTLRRFVGSALLLMGGICFVVLGLGWWLKRLAREATEFYEQAAQAQFLSLTEIIRSRHLERDAELFHRRVLRPEWELHQSHAGLSSDEQVACFVERVNLALLGSHTNTGDAAAFDMLERTVLLYRDSLDGALFVDSDNRTTCQLLGNPAVRQFLALSQRLRRKDVKSLRLLDLERQKSLFGGPYLWFNFIARSTAHSVASLIVDYNRHAIPLSELPIVSPAERKRYQAWLAVRTTSGVPDEQAQPATDETTYVTTAFTALHILDFDAERDREVQQRFGDEVLARLRRDRSLLIRRIFGTYPWQLQPKEQRVLNLYTLYEKWLAGGRALLLPLFLVWEGVRSLGRLAGWICRAVREIRRPDLRIDRTGQVQADFATAVRKIDRMRGPVVYATLQLRSVLDCQYLGVPLPGRQSTGLEGADVESDLQFLDAEPWWTEYIAESRRRAEADMRRLGVLIDQGLLERIAGNLRLPADALASEAHRRAAAAVYLADYRGVRRLLSAAEILDEVFRTSLVEQPLPPPPCFSLALRRAFNRYWRQQGQTLAPAGAERQTDAAQKRRACWWAVVHNVWGAADALRAWDRYGDGCRREGEQIMAELLRHPGRIEEQLVTLRTVQTLAILDVLNYREHIYHLGQYARHGEPDERLRWDTL
jgi:hypothetical protein